MHIARYPDVRAANINRCPFLRTGRLKVIPIAVLLLQIGEIRDLIDRHDLFRSIFDTLVTRCLLIR